MLEVGPKHAAGHAFSHMNARTREGLLVHGRRGMLKASLAGLAGLSLPALLQARGQAASAASNRSGKSLILLWMAGGPSHIDMWDMKPAAPIEIRGPFQPISTRLAGVSICEHLPKIAARMDQYTVIRSVDCRKSNHQPNQVMQTGNRDAGPRVNPKGDKYPAIASVVAAHHGSNHPSMPPYAAFMKDRSHIAWGGYLGKRYDPFIANQATRLPVYTNVGVDTGQKTSGGMFQMAAGINHRRLEDRCSLLSDLDKIRAGLDQRGSMEAMEYYNRQAVQMLVGGRAQQALDLSREPQASRDRYGKHLWLQQVLLARRMVEAGVAFVTLDLSYHGASGTWDTHGDNIPPYGGITKGLGPLLPLFDHLFTTLVDDLRERGLLDDTLVIAMGEFGRTPQIGTQGSTDGRNHWPVVMSMTMAGGGLRHGQVIGATTRDAGQIKDRPVTPADLAATIYRYFGVPLDATYLDPRGRPRYIVEENGQPIEELFG